METDYESRGCLKCSNLRRDHGRAFCSAVAESTCRAFKLHDRDLVKVLNWTVHGSGGKEFFFGAFCVQYNKPLNAEGDESRNP